MYHWLLTLCIFTVYSHTFEDYKTKYNKVYSSSEEAYRKDLFHERLTKINNHNSRDHRWKLGINHLSDRSPSEFQKMLGLRVNFRKESNRPPSRAINLPTDIDWRTKGVLTPVKNQGACGSCWAFSAVQGIESQLAIAKMKQGHQSYLTEFSEQQILDCADVPGAGGCNGGAEEIAYQSIIDAGGLTTEWTYPYTSFFGDAAQCNMSRILPHVKLSDFVNLPHNSYDDLVSALYEIGPIEVAVDATTWDTYESGIFDGCNKTHVELNHAVQLVGIGKEGDTEYWIVRNSWGNQWAEDGYIRLHKSSNFTCGMQGKFKVCGTCGIQYLGNYPIIQS